MIEVSLHSRPSAPPHASTPTPIDVMACGTRWHEQRRRRSRILSTFLEMLNDREAEEVNLAEIAAASGVAVQTIYNLVGNRSQLVGAAIEEWGNAVADHARREAELNGENPIMASLQIHWAAVVTERQFVMRTARLTTRTDDLRNLAWNFASRSFLDDLNRIRDVGGIVPGFHLPTLARQMSYAANASINNWISHQYGLKDFHQDLLCGPGLMLAGVLVGEELEKLHRSLEILKRGLPDIKPIPGMPI